MPFPRQCSLVAFYGAKPQALQNLILELQARVTAQLGDSFAPYDLLQAHATLMALERVAGSASDNRFFHELRAEKRAMDFDGALNFLRRDPRLPFRVQIGGWQAGDRPFSSAGKPPFERSFSIQGDKVVLMGWSVAPDGSYPTTLNDLRHDLARFNLLHKYFRQPDAVDNDFYMRIGLLRTPLDDQQRLQVEGDLRDYLACSSPFLLDVTLADIQLAAYVDDPLTYSTTRHWSLADAQVTGGFIAGLYG